MNNAFVIKENLTEQKVDASPQLRERSQQLTDIIEALQNIENSAHWKVLQTYVFDVELARSKRRLEVESDTAEIFRLQGETKLGRRYHLNKLITKYRNELQAIRQKLNE